jgi:glycosyltransferase involved in cell wall biosynthesis
LGELAARGVCQVALIASTSTAREAAMADELRRAGVTLITTYQQHIQEFYQASDVFVFPVESTDNAIELPLSVLEAFACDLPVVATPFGGLPRLFAGRPDAGLFLVDSPAALVDTAERVGLACAGGTRPLALPYSWEAVADALLASAFPLETSRA